MLLPCSPLCSSPLSSHPHPFAGVPNHTRCTLSSFSCALPNVVCSQKRSAFRVHYEYALIAILKQSEWDFKFVLLPKFPFAVNGRASHVSYVGSQSCGNDKQSPSKWVVGELGWGRSCGNILCHYHPDQTGQAKIFTEGNFPGPLPCVAEYCGCFGKEVTDIGYARNWI